MKIQRWDAYLGCECGRFGDDEMFKDDAGEYVLYEDIKFLLECKNKPIYPKCEIIKSDICCYFCSILDCCKETCEFYSKDIEFKNRKC